MIKKTLLVLMLLFIGSTAGCGYHFIPKESDVLMGMHSMAIPYFKNKTYEAALERYLTEALVDEFVQSHTIAIVGEAEADAVLRGEIGNFRESVISYDKDDQALEYRAIVEIEVTLEKRDTGELLWRMKELVHFEDYRVSSEIAITEANKEQALRKTAEEIAQRIHDSIIEGF